MLQSSQSIFTFRTGCRVAWLAGGWNSAHFLYVFHFLYKFSQSETFIVKSVEANCPRFPQLQFRITI